MEQHFTTPILAQIGINKYKQDSANDKNEN